MALVDPRAIEGEIDCIRSLGLEELRREWWRLNHGEPPRISRDLLVLALGYRLQEVAHGGLGKATQRKLQTMAKALQTTGRVGPAPCLSLKPGARLVREWRGRTHTVTVTEDGFAYGGASYPSLTKIAKIGLRRSGALTCFEFVRDHGIAHASRKAARGAFHLVALAGFLVRDLGAPEASVDLGEIDIIEAHRDSYAGHFMPRAEHMAGWGLDYFKLCHEAPLNQPSSGAP